MGKTQPYRIITVSAMLYSIGGTLPYQQLYFTVLAGLYRIGDTLPYRLYTLLYLRNFTELVHPKRKKKAMYHVPTTHECQLHGFMNIVGIGRW